MLGVNLKKRLLMVAALCLAAPFFCQGQTLSEEFQWLQKSVDAINSSKELAGDLAAPEITPEIMRQAEEAAKKGREHAMSELRQAVDEELALADEQAEPRILIFATLGETPDASRIRTLLEALDGDTQVKILLQGLPVGVRRIDQMFSFLSQVDDNLDAPPEVLLDPQIFKDHQIEEAPVIMYEDEKGNAVAWAKGVTEPEWVRRQVELGRTGDLGVYGTTEMIAERNLLDEIQDRMMAVDWEKKKEAAKKRFWANRAYVELPPAPKNRMYAYYPAYQLTDDFTGPNGEILAPAGTIVNPLEQIQGTFFLIIFDARHDALIEQARNLAKQAPQYKRIKFIATNFNPGENGWSEKARIEQRLGHPLYFADQTFVESFRLQHVPATVTTEGERIVVSEFLSAHRR